MNKKHYDDQNTYTPSSGNVFADLGLENAEELSLKSRLILLIREIIEFRGLSQAKVSEILGIDQPKVSNLITGKNFSVSLEKLLTYLTFLGKDVRISVEDKPETRPGEIQFEPPEIAACC